MPGRDTLPLTACLCAGAHASDSMDGTVHLEDGVLTDEVYEATVEHVDLAKCPGAFDPDTTFCRLTLASDMAHVIAFAFDGEQPLVAVKSYPLDSGFAQF